VNPHPGRGLETLTVFILELSFCRCELRAEVFIECLETSILDVLINQHLISKVPKIFGPFINSGHWKWKCYEGNSNYFANSCWIDISNTFIFYVAVKMQNIPSFRKIANFSLLSFKEQNSWQKKLSKTI